MSEHAELAPTGVVAGLSIDDRFLRVVVLDRRASPTVVDDAEADLDPLVVQEGRVLDHAALGRRIGELWRALGLGGVPTFIGFHPADGRVRSVPVANWPRSGWPAEVLAAVATVRSRYGDEPVWSAAPLYRGDSVSARIAACRREDMSNAVWAARRSGVWVAGVELAGLALERAVQPIAESHALLVDRTGAGAATALLFEHGSAVLGWRLTLADDAAGAGALLVFPLDEGTARNMTQAATPPSAFLASASLTQARPAELLRPGVGLAPDSPAPVPSFAVTLGLALAAAGLGVRPVELQGSLLNTGVAMLQSRLGSRPGPVVPLRLADQASAADLPPAAAEVVGADVVAPDAAAVPPAGSPLPKRARGASLEDALSEAIHVERAAELAEASSVAGPELSAPAQPAARASTQPTSPDLVSSEATTHPESPELASPAHAASEASASAASTTAGTTEGEMAAKRAFVRRRRRTKTVAVVAGAAAVTSFLVARNAGNELQVGPRDDADTEDSGPVSGISTRPGATLATGVGSSTDRSGGRGANNGDETPAGSQRQENGQRAGAADTSGASIGGASLGEIALAAPTLDGAATVTGTAGDGAIAGGAASQSSPGAPGVTTASTAAAENTTTTAQAAGPEVSSPIVGSPHAGQAGGPANAGDTPVNSTPATTVPDDAPEAPLAPATSAPTTTAPETPPTTAVAATPAPTTAPTTPPVAAAPSASSVLPSSSTTRPRVPTNSSVPAKPRVPTTNAPSATTPLPSPANAVPSTTSAVPSMASAVPSTASAVPSTTPPMPPMPPSTPSTESPASPTTTTTALAENAQPPTPPVPEHADDRDDRDDRGDRNDRDDRDDRDGRDLQGVDDRGGRWFDIPLRPAGEPFIAVIRGGRLTFMGAVRSDEQARRIRQRAEEVFGPDQVDGDITVDPEAGVDAGEGVRLGDCVHFDEHASDFDRERAAALDEVSRTMQENPGASVVLEGHSDGQGDLGENLLLSQARAASVGEALVERGVERDRITVKGRGPFVPVADESTEEGRAANRRVAATYQGLLG